MRTTTCTVTGLAPGDSTAAMTSLISRLDGVIGVCVELTAGGTSLVRILSEAAVSEAQVRAAVREAGCELATTPSGNGYRTAA